MPSAQRVPAVRHHVALAIALGVLLGNALVLAWVRAHELDLHAVDIQTRLLYRLRLDAFFEHAKAARAVVVGDSLVYGAHLKKTEGAAWESRSLPGQIESVLRGRAERPVAALNLGINGVLFSDLACVVADVLARRPELLVIGLSPRPFSSDFDAGGGESAREFLCPPRARGLGAELNARASDVFYRFLPAYRYRDLLQFHYLDSTPRGFVVDRVIARVGAVEDEDDPDLAQALQRMRAARRINSIAVSAAHREARGLDQLLSALAAQSTTRALVFYLRENLELLDPAVDRPRYDAEASHFIALVQNALASAPRARFVVHGANEFSGEYVDHIHLTARGYARLARMLAQELPR